MRQGFILYLMKTGTTTMTNAADGIHEVGVLGLAVVVMAGKVEAQKIATLKLAGVRRSAEARVLGAKALRLQAAVLEAMTFDAEVYTDIVCDQQYVVVEASREADLPKARELLLAAVKAVG